MKILTISIAAYNSEKYLEKCLDSFVRCKTLDKLEILVINDGSTDSTRLIAEEYQRRYPGSITVINKENGGHGSTINCSIKLATGKYFKLVDADDRVDSDGLDKLVSFLEDTAADLVLNPFIMVNTRGEITKRISYVIPYRTIEFGKEYELKEIENNISYYMHASTFRIEVVKQISRPIAEHCYYVDVEYILYSAPYVRTVAALDYVVYIYLHGTPEQSVNPRNQIPRRNEHLRVVRDAIQFYYSCNEDTNGFDLIHKRLLGLIKAQYILYFSMGDIKKGKEEIIQFDNYLKEECTGLYDDLVTLGRLKSRLLIKLLRKTKFRGYEFIVNILHVLYFRYRN